MDLSHARTTRIVRESHNPDGIAESVSGTQRRKEGKRTRNEPAIGRSDSREGRDSRTKVFSMSTTKSVHVKTRAEHIFEQFDEVEGTALPGLFRRLVEAGGRRRSRSARRWHGVHSAWRTSRSLYRLRNLLGSLPCSSSQVFTVMTLSDSANVGAGSFGGFFASNRYALDSGS